MSDTLETLRAGELIADRYRIEAPLGHGAMGSVWRATHVGLESPVAIKLLKSTVAEDPEMLDRFLREARSAAAVRGSHVVQIFDYGVDRGLPFIAMELLVGEALDARLERRVLEPAELDAVIGEVARALGHAHALGVVHRDIKPANIFITREGDFEVTKVLDFGIAKLMADPLAAPVGSGTHTGIILGTPCYMSPEQARGERQVDHRSDLWSLAVLAFRCLTGRQPFESATLGDLVVKICMAEPLRPSDVAPVPDGFDAWFARAIQKNREARFQSARELWGELHALLEAQGLGAESRPRSSRPRSAPERLAVVQGETERLPTPSATPQPTGAAASGAAAAGAAASTTVETPAAREASLTTTRAHSAPVARPASRGRWRRAALLLLLCGGAALVVVRALRSPGGTAAVPAASPSAAAATRPSTAVQALHAEATSPERPPAAPAAAAPTVPAGNAARSTPQPTPEPAPEPATHPAEPARGAASRGAASRARPRARAAAAPRAAAPADPGMSPAQPTPEPPAAPAAATPVNPVPPAPDPYSDRL